MLQVLKFSQKNKFFHVLFLFVCITSCSEQTDGEDQIDNAPVNNENLSLNDLAKRHISAALSIPSSEKYKMTIYKEDLNDDHKKDAIIAVNREEFAMQQVAASDKTGKLAEMGFLGNYNYLFYYDGATKAITPAIQITSSAKIPLKVKFEHIQSQSYKDVMVDYRIENASYKNFYFIHNNAPKLVFQWKNFSNVGDPNHEAYTFDFVDGKYSPVRDILVKKATFEDPKTDFDPFMYEPVLKTSSEIAYTFFYNPTQSKYFTMKPKDGE
jgi:hypothetical protein